MAFWTTLAVWACVLGALYFFFKRFAGSLIALAANNKRFKLKVGVIDFLTVHDIQVELAQGPVSKICVQYVSLADSTDVFTLLQSCVRGILALQLQLPVSLRGVRVHLREGPLPSSPQRKPKAKASKKSGGTGGQASTSSLLSRVLPLLLGAVPSVPVRVTDVVLQHKASGWSCRLPNLNIQLSGSAIGQRLILELHTQQIAAGFGSPSGGEAAPGVAMYVPLLTVTHIHAAIKINVRSDVGKLRFSCQAVHFDLGETCLTLSHNLLSALAMVPPQKRRPKAARTAQQTTTEPCSLIETIRTLGAEMCIKVPSITITTFDEPAHPSLPLLRTELREFLFACQQPVARRRLSSLFNLKVDKRKILECTVQLGTFFVEVDGGAGHRGEERKALFIHVQQVTGALVVSHVPGTLTTCQCAVESTLYCNRSEVAVGVRAMWATLENMVQQFNQLRKEFQTPTITAKTSSVVLPTPSSPSSLENTTVHDPRAHSESMQPESLGKHDTLQSGPLRRSASHALFLPLQSKFQETISFVMRVELNQLARLAIHDVSDGPSVSPSSKLVAQVGPVSVYLGHKQAKLESLGSGGFEPSAGWEVFTGLIGAGPSGRWSPLSQPSSPLENPLERQTSTVSVRGWESTPHSRQHSWNLNTSHRRSGSYTAGSVVGGEEGGSKPVPRAVAAEELTLALCCAVRDVVVAAVEGGEDGAPEEQEPLFQWGVLEVDVQQDEDSQRFSGVFSVDVVHITTTHHYLDLLGCTAAALQPPASLRHTKVPKPREQSSAKASAFDIAAYFEVLQLQLSNATVRLQASLERTCVARAAAGAAFEQPSDLPGVATGPESSGRVLCANVVDVQGLMVRCHVPTKGVLVKLDVATARYVEQDDGEKKEKAVLETFSLSTLEAEYGTAEDSTRSDDEAHTSPFHPTTWRNTNNPSFCPTSGCAYLFLSCMLHVTVAVDPLVALLHTLNDLLAIKARVKAAKTLTESTSRTDPGPETAKPSGQVDEPVLGGQVMQEGIDTQRGSSEGFDTADPQSLTSQSMPASRPVHFSGDGALQADASVGPPPATKKRMSVGLRLFDSSVGLRVADDIRFRISAKDVEAYDDMKSVDVFSLAVTLNQQVITKCGAISIKVQDVVDGYLLQESAKSGDRKLWESHSNSSFDTSEGVRTAYMRCGLGHWSTAADSERSVRQTDVKVQQLVLTLPYKCQLGVAIRYTELWAKALKQAMMAEVSCLPHISSLRKPKPATATPKPKCAVHDEIRLSINHAVAKFEQHEMEAWLSAYSPLLRTTNTQQYVWRHRIMPQVNIRAVMEDSAAHGYALNDTHSAYQLVEERLMREVSRAHVLRCGQVSHKQEKGVDDGALMHVSAEALEALIVVCPRNEAGIAAALEHVAAVDEPSKGVPMAQAVKVHLDVMGKNLSANFCGAVEPLVGAGSFCVSGPLAVARQKTAPPRMREVTIKVGGHKDVTIQVSIKGSRPTPKVYTDFQVTLDKTAVWFGPGLDPMFAMAAQCGKRLSPTDPFLSAAAAAATEKLGWWDHVRYLWRGKINLKSRGFEFIFGRSLQPNINSTTSRVEVHAHSLLLNWGPHTKFEFTFDQFRAAGYEETGPNHAAGTLLCVPLMDVPQLCATIAMEWELESGRSPQDHYLFPVLPQDEHYVQEPVSLVREYKSKCMDWSLEVQFKKGSAAAPLARQGAAELNPMLFLGEYQIQFFASLVSLIRGPAEFLKVVKTCGTFFQRRTAVDSSGSIPRIMRQFNLLLSSDCIDLMHWAPDWDGDDPSSRLLFNMNKSHYSSTWIMNQPAPPGTVPTRRSPFSKNRPVTQTLNPEMELRVEQVQLHFGEHTRDTSSSFGTSYSQRVPLEECSSMSSASSDTSTSAAPPCIATMSLGYIKRINNENNGSESAAEGATHPPVQQRKPLSIVFEDLRMFINETNRDALWAMFEHIFSIVLCFVARSRATLQSAQQVRLTTPGPADPARTSLDSSGDAKTPIDAPANSFLSTESNGGDLLQLLLQQGLHSETEDSSPMPNGTDFSLPGTPSKQAATADEVDGELSRCKSFSNEHQVVGWDIQVNRFQICLQADSSKGRALLAAETARVTGCFDYRQGQQITSLNVDQVQAYADKTYYEPDAPVFWLPAAEGKLVPPKEGLLLRRVFTPFSLTFRATKTSSMLRQQATESGRSGSHPAGSSSAHQSARAGGLGASDHQNVGASEELVLKTPEIVATVDPHEFELLIEIIGTIILSPPPRVQVLATEWSLLVESETDEVEALRCIYAAGRQQLVCIQKEAFTVMSALGFRQNRAPVSYRRRADSRGSGKFEATELLQVVDEMEDLREGSSIQEEMYCHMIRCIRGRPGPDGIKKNIERGQKLLVKWADDSVADAREAVDRTKMNLLNAKALARKSLPGPKASRISMQADTILWILCRDDAARTPFIQSRISGLMVDNARHQDVSGSTKFIIHRLEVRDLTGSVSATASTDEGCIIAVWNPTDSWDRDDMVRVTAVMGVPTKTHAVYEHVDFMVHPMGVHLTESVAIDVWHYLFPPEEATKTKTPSGKSLAVSEEDETASPDKGALEPIPSVSPPMPAFKAGAGATLSKLARHRRSKSWDPSGATDGGTPDKAGENSGRSARSMLGGADRDVPQPMVPQLQKRFVHVRFNRVHCRITYTGYPFNITDFKILLDNKVYQHFEGNWRNLLNRYKTNVVTSLLKSATGLQAKKFAKITRAPDAGSEDDDHKTSGVTKKIMSAIRGGTSGSGGDADRGAGPEEDPRTKLKKNLLLGKNLTRLAKVKSSAKRLIDEGRRKWDGGDEPLDGAGSAQ